MKYAGIIENDVVNGKGVCVSFWCQGCPHKCKGCFNPETWNFAGGKFFTSKTLSQIKSALIKNNIQRNFSILGGEPLCEENLPLVNMILKEIRKDFPKIKIFLWTGYIYEELKKTNDKYLNYILSSIDILIDGPFIQEQKDITLPFRGSKNQRIIDVRESLKQNKIIDISNKF